MLQPIKPVAMDQKSAAMVIARFLRKVVVWNTTIRESEMRDEDTGRCDGCGVEIPLEHVMCLDCDHTGPCGACGREIYMSDWAWTGHCSRACARERETFPYH